jgi:sigma-B regulation protein RsbU (phosphoserine phosphatase)
MTNTEHQLTTFLRGDITGFVLSLLVLFVGLAALAVHLLRLKSKDRSLQWFALFIVLYGLRSVSRHAITQELFDAPRAFWAYFDSIISDVIVMPALLFFEAFYGRGWKSSLRWLLWALTAWAVVAIVVNAASGEPAYVTDPSTLLIVALPLILLAGLAFGYRPPQSSMAGIIFAGFTIFLLSVIADHLSRAGLVPWTRSTEPVGFLANLCCLGYVAVQRFVGNEQQLMAVAEEMKSASRIQASILPRGLPHVPGLQIAVRYIPMTAVAGDFYDFLTAVPGGVGILVADVTGHGVPAALVASMVKVTVSSQSGHAADPAPVIAALNQMICQQAQGQFTTAGYLYLDVKSRMALYAGAGHPPLLLWRKANRTLREFQANGLLMGVRPAESYTNTPIELQSGDRFLLYTDGIPEASNSAEEFFGEDRLKAFIEEWESLAADAFADALLARLSHWSGSSRGAQTDDITLVVVDVL